MPSEVIEIASDSEEDRTAVNTPTVIEISSDDDDDQSATAIPGPAKSNPARYRATRKIIQSSSESEDESVRDVLPPPPPTRPTATPRYQSLYTGDSESDSDNDVFEDALDDSIITYDPPKSEKKPLRITPPIPKTPARETVPKKRTKAPKELAVADTQPITPVMSTTPRGAGRTSKREREAAERKELEEYAQRFYNDLNKTVFGNGLPPDTELSWNARLLTTAGRAVWHKNRHGEESSRIELATKVITCKERIRNTLSHEMCHLASWVIDGQVKENHGQIFKKWGSRVMRVYPDVEVSTRHSYDISYKYEWRCVNCSKIYGRHSKSINPDECLCGACKIGRLIPLFETRTPQKTRGTTSGKMASTQPRESPLRVPDLCISIATEDDPSDFLEDLAAAVEGIKI